MNIRLVDLSDYRCLCPNFMIGFLLHFSYSLDFIYFNLKMNWHYRIFAAVNDNNFY